MQTLRAALVGVFVVSSSLAFAQATTPPTPAGHWSVELFDRDTLVAKPPILDLCIDNIQLSNTPTISSKARAYLNYRNLAPHGRVSFDAHQLEVAIVSLSENILIKLNRITADEWTGDVDWFVAQGAVTNLYEARLKKLADTSACK